MRKTIAILLFAAMLAGCAKHVQPPTLQPPPEINKDWSLTLTFNYDFTNFMACSATVTTGCISGFQWGYLSGPNNVLTPLKTSPVSICSGTAQPQACTDTTNAVLPIGNVKFQVTAQYIDNAGVAGSSGVGLSPIDAIAAGVPANVAVKRQ